MQERIVGIYGFDFTCPFTVGGVDFIPLYAREESRQRAQDPDSFQITGYGRFVTPNKDAHADADKVQLITSAMTFIQQQHVTASLLIDITPGKSIDQFVNSEAFRVKQISHTTRHTFGDLIASDTWCPTSRSKFLNTFFKRFEVEYPGDALRQAFFRQIEISRLATPYVELHHFLAFSALELLARSRGFSRDHRNAAVPIEEMLNDLGFSVRQTEVERWTLARNRAFHNGELSSKDPLGGPDIKLTDQLVPITCVLGDVLIKLLPFDDGRINWNRWRDRMAFR